MIEEPNLPSAVMRRAFERAVDAVQPENCLVDALRGIDDRGPALLLGAGKAAASMATAFCAHWDHPVRGLVVTRYQHGLREGESVAPVEVVEAGHPSPDRASVDAGQRLLRLAGSGRDDEQLYWLVSGGGSALAAAALPPLRFEQKRDAANFLIRAGADIREINCVRKHLSGIKGGRLARNARPNRVTTFAISDVPRDDIAAIASGPTIADPTSQKDALDILENYRYPAIEELLVVLADPRFETPKPHDADFRSDRSQIIARASTALSAAQAELTEQGYEVICLGDDLAAEAHILGKEHAQLALQYRQSGRRLAILSGGETRVVLKRAGGRGGRNLEYLAGMALHLADAPGVFALAADTDGIDGHGDHAGGLIAPGILAAGAARGISLERSLQDNDCYRFFAEVDSLLMTGPTRTNVNDFRLIVCDR